MADNTLKLVSAEAELSYSLNEADVTNWWQDLGCSAAATQDISQVEAAWRVLEKSGIDSPGQSLDFTKAWIKRFKIPQEDQLYITGEARGKIVALLPLKRKTRMGAKVLTWFSGAHVGCNAPLIDHDAFAQLSTEECAQVWQRMRRAMVGADLVCLHSIPALAGGDYFSGLGKSIEVETLYRSEFEDWEACQSTQRTRSRKKHDKQQGAKLRAMGEVSFEELSATDPKADNALDVMFEQKSLRFKQWGIEDPFGDPEVRAFYRDIFHNDTGLSGKLHVLSLDGEVIAVRYNLAHGDKMFALISSMSERENLRPGSPGKQNILRAMQSIFEAGYTVCDMGAGFSDEKRHWCNTTIPLSTHYMALSTKGSLIAKLHRFKYRARKFIKQNDRLFGIFKSARSVARGRSNKS